MAAVDHGGIELPKRVTLGNILSIGFTIVTGVATGAFIYGVVVTEVQALRHLVDAIPATYAREADLDRAIQDQKAANADLRAAVSLLLGKASDTNASVAALTATVGGLRDDVGDVRRRLEAGDVRR